MKKEQRKTDIKKKKNIEVNPIPKVALRTNERTLIFTIYKMVMWVCEWVREWVRQQGTYVQKL